jgi:hypothetical protein
MSGGSGAFDFHASIGEMGERHALAIMIAACRLLIDLLHLHFIVPRQPGAKAWLCQTQQETKILQKIS